MLRTPTEMVNSKSRCPTGEARGIPRFHHRAGEAAPDNLRPTASPTSPLRRAGFPAVGASCGAGWVRLALKAVSETRGHPSRHDRCAAGMIAASTIQASDDGEINLVRGDPLGRPRAHRCAASFERCAPPLRPAAASNRLPRQTSRNVLPVMPPRPVCNASTPPLVRFARDRVARADAAGGGSAQHLHPSAIATIVPALLRSARHFRPPVRWRRRSSTASAERKPSAAVARGRGFSSCCPPARRLKHQGGPPADLTTRRLSFRRKRTDHADLMPARLP